MTSGPFYFDACCFIDMAANGIGIAADPSREPHIFFCRKALEAARDSECTVYTSSLTLMECSFVKDPALPNGANVILDDRVKALFNGMLLSTKSGVMPVQPSPPVLRQARELRWTHGITLSAMDALHVGTAISMKCSHFVTTDNFGDADTAKLAALGLVVTTGKSLLSHLPDRYRQAALHSGAKADVRKAAPAQGGQA